MKHEPRIPDELANYDRDNPVRDLPVLLLGIAGAAAAVIVIGALAIDLLVPHVPASWEINVFNRLPIDGFATEAGTKRQLNTAALLMQRVGAHWPDNPYPVALRIIDDEAPNAIALPGGMVLLTTGLLEQVESENELAFVLGHELGHFRNRDHLRGLGRGVVTMLVVGALTDGLLADVGGVLGDVALRSYSREQEHAADAFGLELMYAEYGHVSGADAFFARQHEKSIKDRANDAAYFSTHPLENDRITALSQLAERNHWPQKGRLVVPDWKAELARDDES